VINIDCKYSTISDKDLDSARESVEEANRLIYTRSGKGSDYLGWLNLPSSVTDAEISAILNCSSRLSSCSDVIILIGIGGSYLGARAVISALGDNFSFPVNLKKKDRPLILFAGNNLDEDYHSELLKILDDTDYSIIVISKSGTTTEPAIAFRILRKHLENKYGRTAAAKRIVAVTDAKRGALKKLADEEGYETFVIPDDVGGRYSVLTPVGLLPVACAGYDIVKLISGAAKMEDLCRKSNNPSDLYAAVRNILYRRGKVIEILSTFHSNLYYFTEWWKQLFGESEGKDGKGIFPAGCVFTTDLHSLGQLIQEGERNIFETIISIDNSRNELTVPCENTDTDQLNYLAGKRLSEINKMAELGTTLAHHEGGVSVIKISVSSLDEENLGALIYFFEKACAVSGYILGVNPYDQPGVEKYKTNMFSLLGKPGFEKKN
jgi:glucose-6-phosphate isomerase